MTITKEDIGKGVSYVVIIMVMTGILLPVVTGEHSRIGDVNPQRIVALGFSVPLAMIVSFVFSFFKDLHFRFSFTDGWLLAFSGYWFLRHYVSGNVCPTSALLFLLLIAVYFLIRVLFSIDRNSRPFLLVFLYLTGIIEVIWGLGQLYGFWDTYHSLYKFTGSLFNPGPYSGLLATLFPLALGQSLEKTDKNTSGFLRSAGLICSVSILLLLPAGMSRSAWLAAICGSSWVLLRHFPLPDTLRQFYAKKRIYFFLLLAAGALFVAGAGQGMYKLKKASADGRLLIWQISGTAVREAPLTGQGPGSFAGIYGNTQASYFATHPHSSEEEYLAGTPRYAFNEYLQISLELGIIGLILFTGLVLSALRQAFKQQQSGLAGALTAFLVFAFFSYPLRILPLSLLFFMLLAACSSPASTPLSPGRRLFFHLLFLTFCGVCIRAGYQLHEQQNYLQQWQEEKKYFDMEIYEGTVDHYRRLYPQLKEFAPFLFEYGQCLSKTGQFQESIWVLSEGAQKSSDPMFYNIIGKNELALGHYKAAEAAFMQAFHRVPHRLYPLYLLAKLHLYNGHYEKARQIIRQALEQKPKVMSPAIEDMKNELKKLYEQLPS